MSNLSPRGRQRRLALGVAGLGAGALLLVLLVAADAPRAWRLATVLPFWAGALGLLQARAAT